MPENFGHAKANRKRVGWRFWLLWLLAAVTGTIVVQIVAWLTTWTRASDWDVGWRAAGAAAWAVDGAVTGAVVGTLQWLVLRKKVSHTGLWVLASILGWAASWAASAVLDLSASRVMAVTIDGAIKGAVLGAITGIALVWLLRQPAPPKGVEDQEGIAWRKSFLRTIGYKL